ncbi:hypothetical protein IW136_005951, partial [Coemansia sp. RSA 678]
YMPVTSFLQRVLNRRGTEPDLARDSMSPMAEESAVAAQISAMGPVIAIEGTQAGNILEASPAFSDTSSMDDGKMPEAMSEKDMVMEEDQVDTEQHVQAALPRNAGFMRSFSNVVCIIIGTGCLQIPYAFAKTGWIGIIIVVMSAFIGGYTGILTIRCLYYRGAEHRLHSFPQIGRMAFGRWGQYATQFFNYMYSLGTTCLYIILSGQFIHQLVSTLGVTISQKVWMIIVSVVIWLPVAILKEMGEAAIMAIFGLLASVVVIVVATVMSLARPYTVMNPNEPAPGHDVAIGIG